MKYEPMPVFELFDSHGLPLDIIGLMLKEEGLTPDWQDFMRRAIDQSWTPKRIFQGAEELATPLRFWNVPEFQERLKMMFVVEMSEIK